MDVKKPIVSVMMSVYNNDKYLKEAILSIINQKFNDWELIFINDSSTDKSLKIAKKFAIKDKRIKIFDQSTNLGKTKTIANFLNEINGEYTTFLDGDDFFSKNKLGSQINFMKENKLDVSYSDMVFFYENGKKVLKRSIDFRKDFKKRLMNKSKTKFDLKLRPGFHLNSKGNRIAGFWGTLMLKTDILKKCKLDLSLTRMEDHDLWFQLIGKGYRIKRFPKGVYFYRQHHAQISKDFTEGDKSAIIINKKLKSGFYFK